MHTHAPPPNSDLVQRGERPAVGRVPQWRRSSGWLVQIPSSTAIIRQVDEKPGSVSVLEPPLLGLSSHRKPASATNPSAQPRTGTRGRLMKPLWHKGHFPSSLGPTCPSGPAGFSLSAHRSSSTFQAHHSPSSSLWTPMCQAVLDALDLFHRSSLSGAAATWELSLLP